MGEWHEEEEDASWPLFKFIYSSDFYPLPRSIVTHPVAGFGLDGNLHLIGRGAKE